MFLHINGTLRRGLSCSTTRKLQPDTIRRDTIRSANQPFVPGDNRGLPLNPGPGVNCHGSVDNSRTLWSGTSLTNPTSMHDKEQDDDAAESHN